VSGAGSAAGSHIVEHDGGRVQLELLVRIDLAS
jgi:hypothetical protein